MQICRLLLRLAAKKGKKAFTSRYELFDYKEYSSTGFAATVFREIGTNRFSFTHSLELGFVR